LTKRPYRRRTWTIQSCSPSCANVYPPSNTYFLGHTRVHTPNGILIGSAVLQGLRLRQRDRQTDSRVGRRSRRTFSTDFEIEVESLASSSKKIKSRRTFNKSSCDLLTPITRTKFLVAYFIISDKTGAQQWLRWGPFGHNLEYWPNCFCIGILNDCPLCASYDRPM